MINNTAERVSEARFRRVWDCKVQLSPFSEHLYASSIGHQNIKACSFTCLISLGQHLSAQAVFYSML